MKSVRLQSPDSLETCGHSFYGDGNDRAAARCFREAARLARESGHVPKEYAMRCWLGNSLLWEGCTAEATEQLLEIITCEDPRARPASIYGAITDLMMITTFHGTRQTFEHLHERAEDLLRRCGEAGWNHRLQFLRAVLEYRRGNFTESAEWAILAERRRQELNSHGCTNYSLCAHLKWSLRSLHMTGRHEEAARRRQRLEDNTNDFVHDRLAERWAAVQAFRFEQCDPTIALANAEACVPYLVATSGKRLEAFELVRALMRLGAHHILARIAWQNANNWPFEIALLAVDLAINRKLVEDQIPVWDPDIPGNATPPHLHWRQPEQAHLHPLLTRLSQATRQESTRLETTHPSIRSQRRFDYLRESGVNLGEAMDT